MAAWLGLPVSLHVSRGVSRAHGLSMATIGLYTAEDGGGRWRKEPLTLRLYGSFKCVKAYSTGFEEAPSLTDFWVSITDIQDPAHRLVQAAYVGDKVDSEGKDLA